MSEPVNVDEMRKRHGFADPCFGDVDRCICGAVWPCDAIRLCNALTEARIVAGNLYAELKAAFSQEGGTDETPMSVCVRCARFDWRGHAHDCILSAALLAYEAAMLPHP